jgi:sialate O-acetylesterase
MTKILFRAALASILLLSDAHAEVKLAPIFGSEMVLQRDRTVPVWGKAETGEKVTVSFVGQTKTTTAGADGKWRVDLDPLATNSTPQTLTVSGSNTIVLTDVLIGEVWVCSGQSNMDWKLPDTENGSEATAAANHPDLRLFFVPRRERPKGNALEGSQWRACTPESAKMFSAVGYYFGMELQKHLDVPVGLIHSSWGGTPAEAWTTLEYLEQHEWLRPIVEREKAAAAKRSQLKADYDEAVRKWTEEAEKARAEGRRPTTRPAQPRELRMTWVPAFLWEGMLEPAVPFAIRGAIWYQGESNADRAQQYRVLLPTMIKAWRDKWGQGDFPFLIVQLTNFMAESAEPQDPDWAHLRDAQLHTARTVPNTGLIVTLGLGDARDIHPKNKKDVSKRASRWALETVYGQRVGRSGPVFESARAQGNKMILRFTYVGDGLQTSEGDTLDEFIIAGDDKVWHWAQARIVGRDEIEVWSDRVSSPKAVRYAWSNNPKHPNLTNSTGIPASPFRTDDWLGPTDGKR